MPVCKSHTGKLLFDVNPQSRAPVRKKPCFVQVGVLSDALVLPTSVQRRPQGGGHGTGGLLHHSGI